MLGGLFSRSFLGSRAAGCFRPSDFLQAEEGKRTLETSFGSLFMYSASLSGVMAHIFLFRWFANPDAQGFSFKVCFRVTESISNPFVALTEEQHSHAPTEKKQLINDPIQD